MSTIQNDGIIYYKWSNKKRKKVIVKKEKNFEKTDSINHPVCHYGGVCLWLW